MNELIMNEVHEWKVEYKVDMVLQENISRVKRQRNSFHENWKVWLQR